MTTAVLFGLVLQGLALFVMHATVRGQWLRHSGATLLAAAVVYHGLTEVMQWLVPDRNPTRLEADQASIDRWVILVSVALFVYSVSYALLMRKAVSRDDGRAAASPSVEGIGVWLGGLAVPLLYLSLQGRGAIQAAAIGATPDRDNYVTSGLATQFLIFVVALTGVVVLARFGGKWLLPVLALQSCLLAFVGIRSTIVTAAILVLFGLTRLNIRYSRKPLFAALAVVLLLGFTISSARAVAGREAFFADRTAHDRLGALVQGFVAIPSERSRQAIVDDLVPRFDGNTFGALVLERLDQGANPVGLATMRNNAFLAAPSFINPGKLDEPLERRNEDFYFVKHFGLNYGTDYLPGLFGFMLGFYGPGALLVLAGLLALAFAKLDSWLSAGDGAVRFLISFGMMHCVVLYTNLPSGFLLVGRGVLLFLLVAALGLLVRRGTLATSRHVRLRHAEE